MTAVTAAFEELLQAHAGILHKVTRAYCRDQHDREDLVQEITLQLWRSFPRYDPAFRFSTWMYRVAMNVAISHFRAARPAPVPLDEALDVADANLADPDEIRELYALIRTLDELDRALVVLYLDGHSHAEIASVLGLTPTNAATRLGRAKEQLRDRYMEKTR